jgi:hypothetical protein
MANNKKTLRETYTSIYRESADDLIEDALLIKNLTKLVGDWSDPQLDTQEKIDQLLTLLASHKGIIQNIKSKMV